MKIDREKSVLLVIDMQARVLDLIPEHAQIHARCAGLIDLANDLGVPVLLSTHYARGLGEVLPDLAARVADGSVVHKAHFSCVEGGCFEGRAEASRQQWILCGIEAHACVMLTALDLAAAGKDVFVVSDAIAARADEDRQVALQRMAAAGITAVTREMVFFEWLRRAGTPEFKECSRKYLR